jgi:Bacterial Ig-like domain
MPTVSLSINNTDVNIANGTGTVIFAFSEAPALFALSDTSAVGGTLSNLQQVNATSYTATFTGAANTDINTASVSVLAGSYHDSAGFAGTAGSTAPFTVDTVTPTVPTYTYTTLDDPFATLGSFAEGINKGDQIVGFYDGRPTISSTEPSQHDRGLHQRLRQLRHQAAAASK